MKEANGSNEPLSCGSFLSAAAASVMRSAAGSPISMRLISSLDIVVARKRASVVLKRSSFEGARSGV